MRRALLCISLCFALLFSSIGMAAADDQAASGAELTLNEAISRALAKSEAVRKAELEVDRTKELREEANDELGYTPTFRSGAYMPSVEVAWNRLLMANLTWRMSKKSITTKHDEVALKTCKAYWDVQEAEEQVSVNKENLTKANVELRQARASYDVGIINKEALLGAETTLKQAESELSKAQNDLRDNYANFNELIGFRPEERPLLVERAEFYPVKVSNLQSAVQRAIERSPSIWMAENNVKIKEYTQDLTMATGEYRPYQVRKIEVDQAELEAMNAKDQMKLLARGLYYTVKNIEDGISSTEQALALSEEQLRITELKYTVGMVTRSDVLKAEVSVAQAKKGLYDLITQHAYMKLAFEKPWAYVGGSAG